MLTLTPAVNGTIIGGAATTGNVGWSFNSGPDQFDYLAVGEQLTVTYTVTVTDDNGAEDTQDITLTITGTNDAPVISDPSTGNGGLRRDCLRGLRRSDYWRPVCRRWFQVCRLHARRRFRGQNALGTMGSGTAPSAYPGSASLLNRYSNGYTEFSRVDGSPFKLVSIDLSESNDSQLTGTFTITGTTSTGATVVQTVTKDGTFGFQTVALTGFEDLVTVRIDGSGRATISTTSSPMLSIRKTAPLLN